MSSSSFYNLAFWLGKLHKQLEGNGTVNGPFFQKLLIMLEVLPYKDCDRVCGNMNPNEKQNQNGDHDVETACWLPKFNNFSAGLDSVPATSQKTWVRDIIRLQ